MVRGYHEYKDVWSAPIDGIEHSCVGEPGNPRDTSAQCSHDTASLSQIC